MTQNLFAFPYAPSPHQLEKEACLEKIDGLLEDFESEMFAYIDKYILDGRSLDEVFPVAYEAAVQEVLDERIVLGFYVLNHIIGNETFFIDKKRVREERNLMVKLGHATELSADTNAVLLGI